MSTTFGDMARYISNLRTFDERRERPRPCPCQRHTITGGDPLYCPFPQLPRGPANYGAIQYQPDREMGE
jgi:hypothetical protein